MIVTKLLLKQFRNHSNRLLSLTKTTIIVGRNTAGKTNILEALYILSHGTSFRAERDVDVIEEGCEFCKIEADITTQDDKVKLTSAFTTRGNYLAKKYLVNEVPRTLKTFSDYMHTVLFTPQDIEIITDTPSLRRRYVDSILAQSHKEYRAALNKYEKALRQRNRMLHDTKIGKKEYKRGDFAYWEDLLIENGGIIHRFRASFVDFVNNHKKEVFSFVMHYDHSIISVERLYKYHFEEKQAGITLVGPQRDDFQFFFPNTKHELKEFGSRGEQRLSVLQLKLIEISYLLRVTGLIPVLLLDDIFSELDSENIDKIYKFIDSQQTIITTTHKEFVPKKILKHRDLKIIEL